MEGKHSQSTKRWMKKEKQSIRDRDTRKHKDGHTRRQMGLREGWQTWQCVCVCLCALVSLCSSWASAERQHRGQLKWGVEIKGSAEACSLCIQSPLSPQHPSLHADRAEVKGAMHPATPIHQCPDCTLLPSWNATLTLQLTSIPSHYIKQILLLYYHYFIFRLSQCDVKYITWLIIFTSLMQLKEDKTLWKELCFLVNT